MQNSLRRSRLATALILFVLTAGLAGVEAADANARRAGNRALRGAPLSFTKPVQLEAHAVIGTAVGNGDRQPSGEPSIKVDSTGRIYVAGVTLVGQAAPVWVSLDGGRSFDELTTPAGFREQSPYGAEGDLAIDSQNRVYFVDTTLYTLAFTRWTPSGDGAPDWDFTLPHTPGVPPGADDRPWLAYGADEDGTESLWLYVNHASHVVVYRSTNGGMTWQESTITLPLRWFWPGMIAAPRDSASTAYLFGACPGSYPSSSLTTLCARATHDAGQTWEEVTVAETDQNREIAPAFVANAVDAAGNVYGVWAESDTNNSSPEDRKDDGCDVFYAASTDGGKTWLPKVRVTDGKGCGVFPWITAGDDGRIAIAWYETPDQAAHADVIPGSAKWYLRAAVVTSATTKPIVTSGLADRNPVHQGPLRRSLWDYLQITTGPDGRFHIAYAEDVDAGEDGPLGTGTGLTANSMDTMYVAQRGGPLLLESKKKA